MINNRKKVFISYSWVPEENKQWVEKLAKKLENGNRLQKFEVRS